MRLCCHYRLLYRFELALVAGCDALPEEKPLVHVRQGTSGKLINVEGALNYSVNLCIQKNLARLSNVKVNMTTDCASERFDQ